MSKKPATVEDESRLDRARRPVTPSVFEWLLAALGIAGVGVGASMLQEGNTTSGVIALIVGLVLLVTFAVLLLRRKRA